MAVLLVLGALLCATAASASPDINLALASARISGAAYCGGSPIESWSCTPCSASNLDVDVVQYFDKSSTDTRGFVGVCHSLNRIIVSFEGTSDTKQWMDDLDSIKHHLTFAGASSSVEVHAGFFNAYLAAQSDIKSAVASLIQGNPGYRVLVTGHSLGAALANICSLDLQLTHRSTGIDMYNFGQPRVGNEDYAAFYEQTVRGAHYRFTHHRDPVPHVPLEAMGFKHVGTEVFYTDYNGPSSLRVCDGSGESSQCSDQYYFDTSISDHLNYLGIPLGSAGCN